MSVATVIVGLCTVLLALSLLGDALGEVRAWWDESRRQSHPRPVTPLPPVARRDCSPVVVEGWRVRRELDRHYLEAARQLRQVAMHQQAER